MVDRHSRAACPREGGGAGICESGRFPPPAFARAGFGGMTVSNLGIF